MIFAARRLFPRFRGNVAVLAGLAVIGVPLLVAFFPRWAWRLTMPLLAVTSVGVYLTVPDTEHAIQVMVLTVLGAIVCFAASVKPPTFLGTAVAAVIVLAALADSAGRGAPIARAIGCFGVLLALPVIEWSQQLRTNPANHRRPPMEALVIVHCIVVAFSSRVLIREESTNFVAVVVAGVLLATVAILFAAARPVAAEP